ncbi:hypothetical protein [Nocardia cyriacigeorgica]|nr:hypothetical protein [Nocardia cyriacigeorgica]
MPCEIAVPEAPTRTQRDSLVELTMADLGEVLNTRYPVGQA